MNVRWLKLADKDLDKIENYIMRDNSSAATRVVLRIVKAVEMLAEHPGIGRPGRVEGTKELVIPNMPYIVPYRIKNKTVQILRVLHQAQQWPDRF
ncbi:MAG: type II toxin-antitoxin system RelE/ParE family toxin [Deltaproteobacteria bacterium]|nr:MAG: type II toxin-antitoxin system RelE/ParE family toxin [Deltaproteobacteria bacterium]